MDSGSLVDAEDSFLRRFVLSGLGLSSSGASGSSGGSPEACFALDSESSELPLVANVDGGGSDSETLVVRMPFEDSRLPRRARPADKDTLAGPHWLITPDARPGVLALERRTFFESPNNVRVIPTRA